MKLEKLKGRGCEHLFRHPVHKTYYFRRYTKKTGEVTRGLRTKDLIQAKDMRDQIIKGAKRVVARAGQVRMASEEFQDFIDRKKTMNKSAGTITSITASQKHFEPYFESMLVSEINSDWWEKVYIPEVRVKTHKDRRFFNDWKWLSSFLKQLHESGKIHVLPKLHNPDPRRSVGRALSDEEIELLVNFAQNDDLRLAILMAATMGMRRGEIFGLRAAQVNTRANTIELRKEDTKTRKARTFSISPATKAELHKRAKNRRHWIFESKDDPSKPLHKDGFKTAWANLKRMPEVKISCRFHDLRHTFLTKAFSAPGANPALICNYAGLSLEVATRVYLHLKPEDSKHIAGLVTYDV